MFVCSLQLTYRQNLKWRLMPDTKAGKLVWFNIASARNQWYSKDTVFWLAQMTLYVTASRKFLHCRALIQAVCRYVNWPMFNTVYLIWWRDLTMSSYFFRQKGVEIWPHSRWQKIYFIYNSDRKVCWFKTKLV